MPQLPKNTRWITPKFDKNGDLFKLIENAIGALKTDRGPASLQGS